jgi:tetratricopeptide (TPR) repeat protein
MVVFGYVYWRAVSSKEQTLHLPPKFSIKGDLAQFGAVLIVTAIILFVAYEYNIKVFRMLDATINSYRTLQTGDLNKVVEQYKKALSENTPLDRDSRNSFVQMILEQGGQVAKLPIDQARAIVDFAIAMSNKNLELNQKDSLALLTNAQINYFAATLPYKDRSVSLKYFEVASSSINRAIQASPNRPPQYFVKANMLLSQNKREEAINAIKRAIEINPTFGDSYCQLARIRYMAKANKEGDALTDQCIEFGGAYGMGNPQLLVELASKYVKQDRLDLAIKAIIGAVNLQPEARLYAMLADLYRRNNEFANAKDSALQAISLDPSIKASAEEFIKTLR